MSFKKLNPFLQESLISSGIEEFKPFQKEVFTGIKAGGNFFLQGDEGIGKTTVLIAGIIQKLKGEAKDDSPRAIVLVRDKEKVIELVEHFKSFTRGSDLRITGVYDNHKFKDQTDEIYYGVDIVVGTVKQLTKIYFQNGIHLGELKILAIDDAEFLIKSNTQVDVVRLSESLTKCQYLVTCEKMVDKISQLRDSFMSNSRLVKA